MQDTVERIHWCNMCSTSPCSHHIGISTHLPELLAGILAAYSLQDLGSTRVLFHKSIHLVYIVVNDDVQALVDAARLLDIVGCEFLGHVARFRSGVWIRFAVFVELDGEDAEVGYCVFLCWPLSVFVYTLCLLPRMVGLVMESTNGEALSGWRQVQGNDYAEAQQSPRSGILA